MAMERSPFWKLSAELRNEIYDLTSLTPGGVFIELVKKRFVKYTWHLKPRTCHPNPLALTQVSKDIRAETLGSFYGVNNVSLIVPMLRDSDKHAYKHPPPEFFANEIKRWVHALHPKERGALKTIELDLGTWVSNTGFGQFTERQLAAVLFDLAMTFQADRMTATVWITMTGVYPWDLLEPLPVSFQLSTSSVSGLRALETPLLTEPLDKAEAEHLAGRTSRNLFDAQRSSFNQRYERLRLLADAMEKFSGGLLVRMNPRAARIS